MRTLELQTMINETITTQELCRKFRITPVTAYTYRKRGMPCIYIKGDKRDALRYVLEDVAAWIKHHKKRTGK